MLHNRKMLAPQAVLLLGMTTCSLGMAQSVSIPDETTSYPSGVTKIPPVISQCTGCHGPRGESQLREWPSLFGLSAPYIEKELNEFQKGQRSNPMMQTITKEMSSNDIKQAAAYFGAAQLKLGASEGSSRPKAAEICMACHGDKKDMQGPILFGQKDEYMVKQLQDFKSGKRKDATMEGIAQTLSAAQMLEVSAYFSHQEVQIEDKQEAN